MSELSRYGHFANCAPDRRRDHRRDHRDRANPEAFKQACWCSVATRRPISINKNAPAAGRGVSSRSCSGSASRPPVLSRDGGSTLDKLNQEVAFM